MLQPHIMKIAYKGGLVYFKNKFQEDHIIYSHQGVITDVLPSQTLSYHQDFRLVDLSDQALIPGTVNTHNHSFQSLVRGFSDDLSFEKWRDKGIYKFSKKLDTNGIYIGALLAFSEMIKYGVSTVCDFFYINNHSNDNARAVIEAARTVGIRLVLARTMYDWSGAPQAYQETPQQAQKNCLELIHEFENDPMVSIYPAPHSLHAASPEMIQAGLEISKKKNLPLHMHIAEAPYEVKQVKKKFGKTPIKYLSSLGVCSPKLVGVHCVWVSDDEIEIMAEKNVKVSYNPASNMFLGDGVTPILKFMKKGVVVGLGSDGACSNNRTSVFDEMRTTSLLQKVTHLDGAVCPAEISFKMGTKNGGVVLGLPIGELKKDYQCDFVGLKMNDISLQPFKKKNLIKNIVYALSPWAIESVVVCGRQLKEKGKLVSVSEEEVCRKVAELTRVW